MPLVWAHSEYLKLIRSLQDGVVFDTPPQPVERYIRKNTVSPLIIWRFNHQIKRLPAGKTLRIETLVPAQLRCTMNDWESFTEHATHDTGFRVHFIDLACGQLVAGTTLRFTFYWPQAERWEGKDFEVQIS